MKRAYAAAVMVASGLLAPAAMPAAQAQTTPNDTTQDNQKDSGSTAHRVPPFDPGYWTPERMRDAKPAPMPIRAMYRSRRISSESMRMVTLCAMIV